MIEYAYAPESLTVAAGTVVHDWTRRVELPPDDGKAVRFRFHLPRGMLSRRMSVLELVGVLGSHLEAVGPFIRSNANPRIQVEYRRMLRYIIGIGRENLDEVRGWCQSRIREEDDDIVLLQLGGQIEGPQPVRLCMGGK